MLKQQQKIIKSLELISLCIIIKYQASALFLLFFRAFHLRRMKFQDIQLHKLKKIREIKETKIQNM